MSQLKFSWRIKMCIPREFPELNELDAQEDNEVIEFEDDDFDDELPDENAMQDMIQFLADDAIPGNQYNNEDRIDNELVAMNVRMRQLLPEVSKFYHRHG